MAQLRDVTLTADHPSTLLADKHAAFILAYSKKKDGYEYMMTEHIRMSGIYWGLTAMDLLGHLEDMDADEVCAFVKACQCPKTGGVAPSPGHDPHLLSTLSAVQILATLDRMSSLDVEGAVRYVAGLQNADGSFCGDKWGEVDTRFSMCATATLAILGRLPAIDAAACASFVMRCHNADGGFGTRPNAETHAGQIYCCLGTLSLLGELSRIDADMLGWWLSERQLPSGGLNGRPEKLPDVCYSWWVVASLRIIGRLHWLQPGKVESFIYACQDPETGGLTDRPGCMPDLYHTLFGLGGLSLLGQGALKAINPVLCMPQYVLDRCGVTTHTLPSLQ